MILAGDIGGTKTLLALFEEKEGALTYSHLATYPSKQYPNLETLLNDFLETCHVPKLKTASFAIAGPVVNNICRATNLPWVVEAEPLAKMLGVDKVCLLNDLEANAWAIEILAKDDLHQLVPGKGNLSGNRAVVSPGTGLGEAGLFWDGKHYHPIPCEGGHCEFGPRGEMQLELCAYLETKYGHASYERILSGPGLLNVYQFFRDQKGGVEAPWLTEELKTQDAAKVIAQNALECRSKLCSDALELFVSVLGSEAANCALKFMALGGIYLGGGIPPKILPKLQEPTFFEGFIDKGRFRELLSEIPIHVILDQKASLKGAARFGHLHMR